MAVGADDERGGGTAHDPPGESHRLGGRGQIRDHRLVRQQRLEPALADLGLVRGVSGIPGRVLQDVPQQDARRVRRRIAGADQRAYQLIAIGQRAKLPQHRRLGHRAWQ